MGLIMRMLVVCNAHVEFLCCMRRRPFRILSRETLWSHLPLDKTIMVVGSNGLKRTNIQIQTGGAGKVKVKTLVSPGDKGLSVKRGKRAYKGRKK